MRWSMSYPGYEAQKKAIMKYQKARKRIVLSVKSEVKEELSNRAAQRGMSLTGYILDELGVADAASAVKEEKHESDREAT